MGRMMIARRKKSGMRMIDVLPAVVGTLFAEEQVVNMLKTCCGIFEVCGWVGREHCCSHEDNRALSGRSIVSR